MIQIIFKLFNMIYERHVRMEKELGLYWLRRILKYNELDHL